MVPILKMYGYLDICDFFLFVKIIEERRSLVVFDFNIAPVDKTKPARNVLANTCK